MSSHDSSAIRRYYDRHTPGFLKFGQGGAEGTIHRAVWGPGVESRQAAFHYVDDRLVDLIRSMPASEQGRRHIVDLGCGVGASLCYMAERLPIRGTGITLSPVQARLATERIRTAGLAERVTCVEGDYTALDPSIGSADLAFAIESFVHGPSPERFFAECRRLLQPGGLLVLCDDFRRQNAGVAAERPIERFTRGWRVNALLSPQELHALAGAAGFGHQSTSDLSPWLELGRTRDRAIALLDVLCGWFPPMADSIGHLVGGSALQTCLANGWIGYDFVVFRKAGA